VVSAEDPRFEGKFNGHTHMGMLGSTALAEFDVFLDWAEKNIPNPIRPTPMSPVRPPTLILTRRSRVGLRLLFLCTLGGNGATVP
jgi:hypothetical protein